MISSMIVWRVLLRMIRRRHNRHLVSVDVKIVVEPPNLLIDFKRCAAVPPRMHEVRVHGPWTEFIDFAKSPKDRKFLANA